MKPGSKLYPSYGRNRGKVADMLPELRDFLRDKQLRNLSECKIGEKNPMHGVRLTGEANGMFGKTGEAHHGYRKPGPTLGKKMPPRSDEQRANYSASATRRDLGKPARDWVYVIRNNTRGGELKVGRTTNVARRLTEHKSEGYPVARPIWKRGDDLEVIFQWRVHFTNDAEAEIRDAVCGWNEIAVKPEAEVLKQAALSCSRWDF